MSQTQIEATVLLCRLLDRTRFEIDGATLLEGSDKAAGRLLQHERLLTVGRPLDSLHCPECGMGFARVVRDEPPDQMLIRCPECWEVTVSRRYREVHRVAPQQLVRHLLNGLGLSPHGVKPIDTDQIWRLGTTEARRGQPVTWYFARRLKRPEVALKVRETLASDQTFDRSVVLTTTHVPLPAGSLLTGCHVRNLGMIGHVGPSTFSFYPDHIPVPGAQPPEEADPGTTVRYVESRGCVFIAGVEYSLEPRQRQILLALLRSRDHELDKEELKNACGSQAQRFTPRKEFDRNPEVYKAFIDYLQGDQLYRLRIPADDRSWLF